jgi:hypothetical protein
MVYHRFLLYTDFACWGILDDIPPGRDLVEWLNSDYFEQEDLHTSKAWVSYVADIQIIFAEMDTNGLFLERVATAQNYSELVWHTHYDCSYSLDTTPYEQRAKTTLASYYEAVLQGTNGVSILDTGILAWQTPIGWPVIYLSLSDHNPERDSASLDSLCSELRNVKI